MKINTLQHALSAFNAAITRIKHSTRLGLIIIGAAALPGTAAMATSYYVDSVAGVDTNSGTSTAAPWKTLDKVNTITFAPGDSVLFKRGSSWTGSLHLLGDGSPTAPLTVDGYGTGAAPIISGTGLYAIGAWNKHNLTIQNMEILNTGTSDGTRQGIYLVFGTSGTYSGNKILNNNIHDVRGVSARGGYQNNAAIYIFIQDPSVAAKVDNLLIQGNDIHDIKTIGIFQKAPPYYATHPELWATNMVIRDNIIDHTGADCITINGAEAPLIEYNAGYDAGINGVGYGWIAGMWSAVKCDNATFQFNEVARVHNELAPGDGDSQAFDADLGALGTNLFQYNYTHDNVGGILIEMNDPTVPKTVIYRYNLSVNDDRQTNSGSQFPMYPTEGMSSGYVYNNVFYTTLPLGYKIHDNKALFFNNNIFYAPSGLYPSQTNYSNNCYFGHNPDNNDPYKVLADPKFAGPLPTTSGSDGYVPANLNMFLLQPSSPCINAGVAIANNGGEDFYGNTLYSGTYADIGIQEVVGGTTPPPAPVTITDNPPSSLVVYSGSWSHTTGTDSLYYNLTRSDSTTVGNSVTYNFTGSNVSVIGRKGPGLGKFNASIDSGTSVLIDCYWPQDVYRKEMFLASGLTSGTHSLNLTVATKNASSTSNRITIDDFMVRPVAPSVPPVVTQYDIPANGIFSGSWSYAPTDLTKFYGGTRAISSTVGDTATFTFTGNGVRIYGTRAVVYGKLSVTVDGGAATVVDCFSPGLTSNYDYMVKLFETNGLTTGTHTLVATVATKNPISTGNSISLDLFEVLTGGSTPADMIIDNASSSGVTITGSWTSSTFTPGYYGADYIHDGNTGKGSKSVRFTPNLPVAASYEAFAWWTSGTNRASNVPIDIVSTSGTTTVQVNQQLTGGQWVSLGTYPFNSGTNGSILIRNTSTNGFVMADAVRFLQH